MSIIVKLRETYDNYLLKYTLGIYCFICLIAIAVPLATIGDAISAQTGLSWFIVIMAISILLSIRPIAIWTNEQSSKGRWVVLIVWLAAFLLFLIARISVDPVTALVLARPLGIVAVLLTFAGLVEFALYLFPICGRAKTERSGDGNLSKVFQALGYVGTLLGVGTWILGAGC